MRRLRRRAGRSDEERREVAATVQDANDLDPVLEGEVEDDVRSPGSRVTPQIRRKFRTSDAYARMLGQKTKTLYDARNQGACSVRSRRNYVIVRNGVQVRQRRRGKPIGRHPAYARRSSRNPARSLARVATSATKRGSVSSV